MRVVLLLALFVGCISKDIKTLNSGSGHEGTGRVGNTAVNLCYEQSWSTVFYGGILSLLGFQDSNGCYSGEVFVDWESPNETVSRAQIGINEHEIQAESLPANAYLRIFYTQDFEADGYHCIVYSANFSELLPWFYCSMDGGEEMVSILGVYTMYGQVVYMENDYSPLTDDAVDPLLEIRDEMVFSFTSDSVSPIGSMDDGPSPTNDPVGTPTLPLGPLPTF